MRLRPRAAPAMRARLALPTVQGGHCPQLSRSKKRSTDAASASGQAEAPVTRIAAVPSALPAARSASGSSGVSSAARGQRRAGRPAREHEADRLAGSARPLDHLAERRAERHLVDPRPLARRPTPSRASSRRGGRPRDPPRAAARAPASRRSARAWAGRPGPPPPASGGFGRGHGRRPSSALEQRRLLARDVAVVAAARRAPPGRRGRPRHSAASMRRRPARRTSP